MEPGVEGGSNGGMQMTWQQVYNTPDRQLCGDSLPVLHSVPLSPLPYLSSSLRHPNHFVTVLTSPSPSYPVPIARLLPFVNLSLPLPWLYHLSVNPFFRHLPVHVFIWCFDALRRRAKLSSRSQCAKKAC